MSQTQSDSIIAKFEADWLEAGLESGRAPSLGKFLNSPALLRELALVDLEFRWRATVRGVRLNDTLGGQPRVEDYARLWPAAIGEISPEMAAEEYRARQLFGDGPNYDHFVSRFPQHREALLPLLRQVDAELTADDQPLARRRERKPIVPAAFDPRAPLPHTDFLLQRLIGAGGMGKVYLAQQRSLGRQVAVKALLKSRQRDAAAVERFIEEGRILGRLRHPHVVGVYGLGRFPGGGYFLVLEFIAGPDLNRRLEAGWMNIPQAMKVAVAVAEAIGHAHEHGVLHCDLKPSNVLLSEDGQAVVTDFGLAQLLVDGGLTSARAGGTPGFMAPEQLDGSFGAPSAATDVYGVSAVLFAMLTGQAPLATEDRQDLAGWLRRGAAVRRPSSLRPDVPASLEAICLKGLNPRPEQRFGSVAELAAALAAPS